MQTLAEFLSKHNISMTAERATSNLNMGDDMFHWLVTLSHNGQQFKTLYSMGYGHVEDKNGNPVHNYHYSPKQLAFIPLRGEDYENNIGWTKAKMRGYRAATPKVSDVLDCLASDSSGYDNARNFEDWASEYGYDTDSRKAYATYQTVAEQAKALKHFLGEVVYTELLFDTERE